MLSVMTDEVVYFLYKGYWQGGEGRPWRRQKQPSHEAIRITGARRGHQGHRRRGPCPQRQTR